MSHRCTTPNAIGQTKALLEEHISQIADASSPNHLDTEGQNLADLCKPTTGLG